MFDRAWVTGYTPSSRRVVPPCGAVAQLGERLNGIQEVEGSTPFGSTPAIPHSWHSRGQVQPIRDMATTGVDSWWRLWLDPTTEHRRQPGTVLCPTATLDERLLRVSEDPPPVWFTRSGLHVAQHEGEYVFERDAGRRDMPVRKPWRVRMLVHVDVEVGEPDTDLRVPVIRE